MGITMSRLCQQRMLLAGVALLCLFLPLCIGPAAQAVLTEGGSFSGLELAVTGPEDDPVPELLEQVMGNMSDISEYCSFTAMDYEDAVHALEQGEVTAVMVLPEDFIRGVMNGTNPDVDLIVSPDRPLESLLTLWVGQSASDILTAFQSGIYAVLDIYRAEAPRGLSYGDVVTQINLRYVNWTMNRQDLFRLRTISATDQLPVEIHYGLSLLSYLLLAAAPVFVPIYDRVWLRSQRRYRAVGRGPLHFYFSGLAASALLLFPIFTAAQLLLLGGSICGSACAGAMCALFCAAFAALCCLLTGGSGGCGVLTFLCSLGFLALAGGILPPVLLPRTVQNLMQLSPVTWMRCTMAYATGEYEVSVGQMLLLAIAAILMTALGAVLYCRRAAEEERP